MAGIKISLISDLVLYTGFELGLYNDAVMELLLGKPVSQYAVHKYLKAGFLLTDYVIKRVIASAKPHSLELLFSLCEKSRLFQLAEAAVYELFGPYHDRNTSLNIPWDSQGIDCIVKMFCISESIIGKCLLHDPASTCTFDSVHANFPVTRPYLKAKPYAIWRWVLDTYGPHHRYTMACFDDAISRASSDTSLHHTIETLLDAGVVLRPRHVKIIACRILHRNMTKNALSIMVHLRKQLNARRRTIKSLETDDDINQVSEEELMAFLDTLNLDILQNDDWQQKSQTIQLGGGSNGGAFRISKAPANVVKFIFVCSQLAEDIENWTRNCITLEKDSSKESKPKSAITSFSMKRVKL